MSPTCWQKDNRLTVEVDNSINDRIYPQKADFTFYGGIYRDISLMVVSKNHIALGHFGDTGVKITPALKDGKADIRVETLVEGEGVLSVELLDAAGNIVATAEGADAKLHLETPPPLERRKGSLPLHLRRPPEPGRQGGG